MFGFKVFFTNSQPVPRHPQLGGVIGKPANIANGEVIAFFVGVAFHLTIRRLGSVDLEFRAA